MHSYSFFAGVILCLLSVLGAACGGLPHRPSQQSNVVLIVIDTVRPDHVSALGYERPTTPFLETFADSGVRFERAWSTSSWTLPAHASMLTGLLPTVHMANQTQRYLQPRIRTILEPMTAAHMQTVGFSNNPWFSRATGLARGFGTFCEMWRPKYKKLGSKEHPTVREVREWLEREMDPDRPFFMFVNLMEAHRPYDPDWKNAKAIFPSRPAWIAARKVNLANEESQMIRQHYLSDNPGDEDVLRSNADLYDAEIHKVDDVVRQVMELVDTHTVPTHTTVFVVSDHGESFGDHGHIGHIFSVYDNLLRVVLIARGPGFQAGRRETNAVQLVDLFPTMASSTGIQVHGAMDGLVDLHDPIPRVRSLQASYDFPLQVLGMFKKKERGDPHLEPYMRALQAGIAWPYKLIRDSNGMEEMYDIQADPDELLPLADMEPELLERMRAVAGTAVVDIKRVERAGFSTHASPMAPGAPIDDGEDDEEIPSPDKETLEALKRLGYM